MSKQRIWISRLLIGTVLFFNLQCALAFLANPQSYTAGFGLSGRPGRACCARWGCCS